MTMAKNICLRSRKSKKGGQTKDHKKIIKDYFLLCGIIIIIFGCIFLFAYMDEDEWAENTYIQQRVLLIGGILFMSATGLCLYVMRTDKLEQGEELILLVIDKPPTYESVILQEPPPAYITVVKSIHIVQQETTG